ncbi:intraflagellar transport complex 25-27 [Baffinella frigidus]|nr:intraflagellar transport complex 25-27 [Cryptophyta sp. CCMP2293]|mmetsp:Transcript_7689/g.18616  ORF Transcript_7689/g.18616 Transcript_7689/m.18616 type:complete len:139 (+) Transcript_7689:153-569(+)
MTDYGTATSGTEIAFSSCVDERHPPENIIDGTDRSFWVTTGLFPQTVLLRFSADIPVARIKTITTNVRKLIFETSSEAPVRGEAPKDFQVVHEVEVADRNGRLQTENNTVNKTTARFLRITVASGWDDFASIRRISIE